MWSWFSAWKMFCLSLNFDFFFFFSLSSLNCNECDAKMLKKCVVFYKAEKNLFVTYNIVAIQHYRWKILKWKLICLCTENCTIFCPFNFSYKILISVILNWEKCHEKDVYWNFIEFFFLCMVLFFIWANLFNFIGRVLVFWFSFLGNFCFFSFWDFLKHYKKYLKILDVI